MIMELEKRKPDCKKCSVKVTKEKECDCLVCIWRELGEDMFKPKQEAK